MEKEKNTFETVLGFATLIISLSAFKDELKKISIDFITWKLNGGQFLLSLVIALSVCYYFFVIQRIASDWFEHPKFWGIVQTLLLFLFGVILFVPPALFAIWCFVWLVHFIPTEASTLAVPELVQLVAAIAAAITLSFQVQKALRGFFSHRDSIKAYNLVMTTQREAVKFIGKGNYLFSASTEYPSTSLSAINTALSFIFRQHNLEMNVQFLDNINTAIAGHIISADQGGIISESYNGIAEPNTKLFNFKDANSLINITANLLTTIDGM